MMRQSEVRHAGRPLRPAIAEARECLSRLVELEPAEAAYKIAIKDEFGNKRARKMRTGGRALRRASRLVGRLATVWSGVLNNFSWGVVEPYGVTSDVPTLMRRGLGS
ncbi:MAG: hypothetical protein ACYDGN_09275 [Acidimicrobiales bacterium]